MDIKYWFSLSTSHVCKSESKQDLKKKLMVNLQTVILKNLRTTVQILEFISIIFSIFLLNLIYLFYETHLLN